MLPIIPLIILLLQNQIWYIRSFLHKKENFEFAYLLRPSKISYQKALQDLIKSYLESLQNSYQNCSKVLKVYQILVQDSK